ncbi:MAG: ankyrin repeat domain-containing protein [Leptospiraceae bacterium]|nr:ankyrin repeat domain-containing protein [Leptospiraceae bacterium]MCP5501990.1 ankyrin repeat domain-containing protein [Leptospiraceae bacterium]
MKYFVLFLILFFSYCKTKEVKPVVNIPKEEDRPINKIPEKKQESSHNSNADEFLMQSVRLADYEGVIQALKDGANPDTANEYGNTVLMWSAFEGYTDIVKKLIESGASVNQKDVYKKTALMFAKDKNRVEIIQLLKQAGAVDYPAPKERVEEKKWGF